MPHSIRHSLILLSLLASAAACSPGQQRSNGPEGSGGRGGGGQLPGVSGTGQAGRGGDGNSENSGGSGAAIAGSAGSGGAAMGVSRPPNFVKTRLNAEFYSEGINYGDVDRDGVLDVIAGPYVYPGPDFAAPRPFREPRATPFDSSGDSDCYTIFVHDLNQDGWPDILSFRLPGGAEAVWYENPKSASGYWAEHVAYSAVDNESATFVDIDADGKPELVTQSNGYGGWAQPDWSNPRQPWTFRNVTEKGNWGRYTHGLGVGDVNADGRLDLIFAEGWWEQPASSSALPWAAHEAVFWGQQAPGEGYGGAQIFTDDVDGDGDNDIVTSLQAHGWGLAWFEQTDAGFVKHLLMNTREEEAQYGAAFAQLHALALADLDGDGDNDIVTGKRKGAHGNGLGAELDAPAVLYWFELVREPGQPPRYEPHLIDSEAGIGTQVVVGDINADGRPDVLTAARAGAFVFLNQ
jgi:hypothetical protein